MLAEVESPIITIALIGSALVVAMVVCSTARDVVRRRRMQGLAAKYGLTEMKNRLPAGIAVPIIETDESACFVTNGMWGGYLGRGIAIFDLRTGYGRHTSMQTVVAVKGQLSDGKRCSTNSLVHYEVQMSAGWLMAFLPGEMLDMEDVEALLASLLHDAW